MPCYCAEGDSTPRSTPCLTCYKARMTKYEDDSAQPIRSLGPLSLMVKTRIELGRASTCLFRKGWTEIARARRTTAPGGIYAFALNPLCRAFHAVVARSRRTTRDRYAFADRFRNGRSRSSFRTGADGNARFEPKPRYDLRHDLILRERTAACARPLAVDFFHEPQQRICKL